MSGIGFEGVKIGFIPGGPGAGAAPTGPAGGDLAGNYPNPLAAKLQGHPVSAAAPTTGDLLVWTGTTWVPTPPPLFGTEFVSGANFVPVSTTNAPASALTFLSLGSVGAPIPLNPAGVYAVGTTFVVDVSAASTAFWVELYFGGVPTGLGPSIEQLSVAGGSALRTTLISTPAAAVPSPFWIDLAFAKYSGPGSVTLRAASINVWRVG